MGALTAFFHVDRATIPLSTVSAAVATVAEDTTVVGDAISTRFGPVQIQATFAPDGSLAAVDAVLTPSGDGRSVRINQVAVPRLNAEALTAQSARVDTISGATYTSLGYERSLQSAIDAANAQGVTQLT